MCVSFKSQQMMITAPQLIQQYHLQPHPEGGWYRETYRSRETISSLSLPGRFGAERNFSTAIYFLLEQGNFSAFHKIKSDECWHFYAGDPLELFILEQSGNLTTILLGPAQAFQYIVPANCWFASRPATGSKYCFMGCTVAPGFDFADFEIGDSKELSTLYPRHEILIKELCR